MSPIFILICHLLFSNPLYGLLEYLFIKCDRVTAGIEQPNCQDVDSKIKTYLAQYQHQLLAKASANGAAAVEKNIPSQVDILVIHSIQVSFY